MAIMNTPVVYGGDMAVKDEIFLEAIKRTLLPLWNAYSFFVTYASIDQWTPSTFQKPQKSDHFLDQWMLAELDTLITQIDTHIASYAVHKASESLIDFLDILTNRYIRRSRRRFWSSDQSTDKTQAYETLYYVLVTVCQISAPLIPFISEYVWKQLTAPVFGLESDTIRSDKRSVHLVDFPVVTQIQTQDQAVSIMMNKVRSIVKAGLGWRARRVLRVRQPLASLTLSINLDAQYLDIIAEELNIKQILVDESLTERVQRICKPNARLLGPKFGKQVQELIVQGKQ
jgi:isoleucyl-tRNA synthetase